MIYGSAKKIAFKLASKDYIPLDDIDLIAYSFFVVLSKFIYGTICAIIGLTFSSLVESIVFYISFLFVRKYAGGFHAKTEGRCFFLSALSIMISILVINFSEKFILLTVVVLCLSVVSYGFIFIYAPVASKEKPIDEDEFKRYRDLSKKRIVVLMMISLFAYVLEHENICISISIAIVLSSILLVAGKIKMQRDSMQNG